jgi:YfiH family protein
MSGFRIEESPLGRIAVAPSVPAGCAVFYTSIDFLGRITDELSRMMTAFIRERFGIDASMTTCYQVHSATVRLAQHEPQWRECDACDALWSADRHVALGIKVADCLPVAIIDSAHSVIANVHSGWRGTVQNITSETIDALQRSGAFAAAAARAYLGPSIRACCFEVGEEVVREFTEAFEGFERYVDRTQAKPHIDLPAVTRDILQERGFREENIFDSQICTRCEDSIFHSYRRAGKGGGRNLALVAQ